jgi:addiction module RelE/StbE family toxin
MGRRSERAKTVVELTSSAKRDLKRLKKELTTSAEADLYEAFEIICSDPLSGKSLQGNFSEYYSFRFCGNYRIIYKIVKEPKETIIRIFGIGDRKDIYDKLSRFLSLL